MTLTCCCGAALDIGDDRTTQFIEERFYNAHADCLRKTDDDAFWIRQYAGMAMQGMISEISWERLGDDFRPEIQPKYEVVAHMAVKQALALLEEVKKHEN